MSIFKNDWDEVLKEELTAPYFYDMGQFLLKERNLAKTIYPNKEDYFKALKLINPKDIKVVLLNDEPYCNGQADGLAFSVSTNDITKIPDTLQQIFNAIEEDVYANFRLQEDWCLERWVNQGVLLLNASLSVEKNKPNSHSNIGWKTFTSSIISYLSAQNNPIIFVFIGEKTHSYEQLIENHHYTIRTEHPLDAIKEDRRWEHKNVFTIINKILKQNNNGSINW